MPKTPIDYSKTSIYKICCNDTNITECYVGHTTNFTKRKNTHKYSCNTETHYTYKLQVYQYIRANGGWENWSMIQIEEFACENQLQAKSRERYWIETLKPKLNCSIPTRTDKEYYNDNKETILEYQDQYYQEHKTEKIEYQKQYAQEHKAEIKDYKNAYYQQNKLKQSEKAKQIYTCKCGSILTLSGKSNHNKSVKHLTFINSKP